VRPPLPRKPNPDRIIYKFVQVMVLEAAYVKGTDAPRSVSGSVLLNRSPVEV
jgi:hypothetical protein